LLSCCSFGPPSGLGHICRFQPTPSRAPAPVRLFHLRFLLLSLPCLPFLSCSGPVRVLAGKYFVLVLGGFHFYFSLRLFCHESNRRARDASHADAFPPRRRARDCLSGALSSALVNCLVVHHCPVCALAGLCVTRSHSAFATFVIHCSREHRFHPCLPSVAA